MKKIISLFERNYQTDRLVRDEVVPGAEWVIAGEGVATRKYDGTCCLIENGRLFKRYEVKAGGMPPPGFVPANEVDPATGKQQGWMAVGAGPEDKFHREAFSAALPDGTYELLGPKIQGNPEKAPCHVLLKHSNADILVDCPRDFAGLRDYFSVHSIEGVVWHHPDGRMVKIKAKDFGIRRSKNQY